MYGGDNNLLSEEVLGKQFGYYSEAKKKKPGKRIINVLLLPANEDGNLEEGFADTVIIDPHNDDVADPDKVIFVYHYPANSLIMDYYYSKRRIGKIHDEFEIFINQPSVRKFLDARKTSY